MSYQPSNPRKRSFSPSSIQLYLQCKRKFYLSYLLGLESTMKAPALAFGSAIHSGLATYFKSGKDEVLAIQAFTEAYQKFTVIVDPARTLLIGVNLLKMYFSEYKNDVTPIDPNSIEINFALNMPNNTVLMGVIDAVIRDKVQIVIQDHKTTTSKALSDYYFNAFHNDFPTSAYFYAALQILGQCDAIQIDAIRVPGESSKDFQRRTFIRTDLQMEEWLNTYIKVTDEILDFISLADSVMLPKFHQNQNSCGDYGGCHFLSICQHGLNHPALRSEFKVKDLATLEEI